jgi:putative molybdopterin biosynthesis protein
LQARRADLAGIHLLDIDSGEYNVPFVKHLLPEEPVVLVNLAYREQGLMIAPGNPKGIYDLHDLIRLDICFVNRQRGSGTRLLLYHRLRQAGIDPHAISGYDREAPTHNAVAAAITSGTADVGPGIRAVAQAWGLEFIPFGLERFDLAITHAVFDSPRLRSLLEVIHQTDFRRAASAFSGYNVTLMGEVVAEIS